MSFSRTQARTATSALPSAACSGVLSIASPVSLLLCTYDSPPKRGNPPVRGRQRLARQRSTPKHSPSLSVCHNSGSAWLLLVSRWDPRRFVYHQTNAQKRFSRVSTANERRFLAPPSPSLNREQTVVPPLPRRDGLVFQCNTTKKSEKKKEQRPRLI